MPTLYGHFLFARDSCDFVPLWRKRAHFYISSSIRVPHPHLCPTLFSSFLLSVLHLSLHLPFLHHHIAIWLHLATMDATTSSAATSSSQIDPTVQPPTSVIIDNTGAVTEDEAALYDRQIRLWGLEAQNRLRTAHILIVGWNGIAIEVVKNTVLSGIGSITLLDPTPVDASIDLLSGFFFRDDDVGQPKCSQGPLDRVRALNPLVKVYGVSDKESYETLIAGGEKAVAWLKERGVDVVVVGTPLPETSVGGVGLKEKLIALNDTTRAAGVKFFLSATYGFGGFYFADQLTHDYIVERTVPPSSSSSTETEKKRIKQRQSFIPLSSSLSHTFTNLTDRQQKRTRLPLDWFIWLSLTDLSSRLTPDTSISHSALRDRTTAMIREKGLNPDIILSQYSDTEAVFESVVRQGGEGETLAPVGSVLGGVLSQDILNGISGREEPVVNWLFLSMDASGAASVHKIGGLEGAVVVD